MKVSVKKIFYFILIVYSFIILKYFSKFTNDTTLYIEDEEATYLENNGKVTVYDIPPKIKKENWNEFHEKRIHRFFYARKFYCNAPKDTQLQVFVFPPSETPNLYPKTNFLKLFQSSDIDIFNPDVKEYPKFKNSEYIEFPLSADQAFTLPKGWWLCIENTSYVISQILI